MLEKLRVVFTIPELRNKIFLTLALLAVYRIGWQVPLPVFNQQALRDLAGQSGDGLANVMRTVAIFSATNLQGATIFGLGIMPYISASIILQLMATFYPPLEALQKEGEAGRKKINQYTRLLTVALALIQSYLILGYSSGNGSVLPEFLNDPKNLQSGMIWYWQIICVLIMTTGTVFLMWLGEQIDEYGIGNGISLLIMANILSELPGAMYNSSDRFTLELGGSGDGRYGVEYIILLLGLFYAVVLGVIMMTLGQRRIPTHSAKHVKGNKVYGGTKEYLPLKVNQSGVMPIIFASSLLLFPQFFFTSIANFFKGQGVVSSLANALNDQHSLTYMTIFVGLIFFFCFFWTAISFNPKDIADNLKNMGAFIPGHRPGTPTASYLEKVMVRITYIGAGFLALVAILPLVLGSIIDLPSQITVFYGGTSLLIAVSVAFDLVQKIDSHLVMRNYRGLLQ
ncbi:MAG: preprotein translocase subunit SecY [Pirellulales bacterium]|nr:preprotein translocase subunit SecY [Pirellulales bacterium]